jgi:sugar transferase (PEP-CTERM/EpsH1 system associated)
MKATASGASLITSIRTAKGRPQVGARRLRVLHILNRLDVGGTEAGVLKVIDGLDAETFEHGLCATRGFNPDWAQRHNLRNEPFVAGRPDTRFQFLVLPLIRIMRTYRPHVVHSRNWGSIEAILAGRLARVPVVIHSEHGYELDMLRGLPIRRRLLRNALYAIADAVFTVTDELRCYHAEQAWVSANRICVIRNGVDTKRFAPNPERGREIRQKLRLPSERLLIGTVGRMVAIKDHMTLLRAAEMLLRRGVDLHLLLVGSGPQLAEHERYVEDSTQLRGHVSFAGTAENVPELLNAMDVFVLPSISEGMSNTLMEAMASGLPVLASRVGGNPEVLGEELSGCLFPPGDTAALADHVERLALASELRCALAAANRRRATERFSLDRMLADYGDLYLKLAQARGAWPGE